ncbi:MAG: HEAT repeat domain-containing protein [Vicinamibacteria bacterium]|nr:HEAT repeat domain-containing protein [Vicinamibacteria bacterium]
MKVWSLVGIFSLSCCSGVLYAAPTPCDEILANLRSPAAKTRQQAASSLATQNCADGIEALSAIVRDAEVEVRLAVVKTLRKMHDRRGIPALTTLTRDGSPDVRSEAVRGILETYSETSRRGSMDRILDVFSDDDELTVIAPWEEVDPAVHRALSGRLRDEAAAIRKDAATALGVLRGRSAIDDLVMALNDPNDGVRAQVVTALERLGAEKAGGALIPLLNDDSMDVRSRAIRAVKELRVRDAAPMLREIYAANRPRGVQQAALASLSHIGDPRQRDFFLSLAQDPDPETRRWVIEGLARISDRSLLAAFKKDFQRERDESLRLAHAFALTLLGDRAFIDTLVLGLSSRTSGMRCRKYIIELGRAYLTDLYPYLGDPDAGIRAGLAGVLGQIGDPAAIPYLEPLLRDPSVRVTDEANRAVERLRRMQGSVESDTEPQEDVPAIPSDEMSAPMPD